MKHIKKYKDFITESQVNEASVEKRGKYQGINFNIMHNVPKGYFIVGTDSESKNIFKGNLQYFDKIDQAEEHAELEIDGYLDEGVDHGKEVEVNEGSVKNIVSQHTSIALDLDHLCNQAQIIRSDLQKVMQPKDMKEYDKKLAKLRIAILDFSSVFENK